MHVHVRAALLLTEIKYQKDQKHTRQSCWDNQSQLAKFFCVCVRVCDKDRAIQRGGEREREVKQGYTVQLGAWPASVSAQGNWSHKSNRLSDVAVGLLGCFTTQKGQKWRGEKRESQSFTVCITHAEPECNFP